MPPDEVVYRDIERVARKTHSGMIANQGNVKAKESFNDVNESIVIVNAGMDSI